MTQQPEDSLEKPKLWEQIISQARQGLVDAGYPIPRKPLASLESLQLPDDVEALGGAQLANILMRLHGWYAYGTAQLAFARAEFTAVSEYFEIELGVKMYSLSLSTDGRPTKDILKALALRSNPLNRVAAQKAVLDQRVRLTEGMVKSLEIQCKALTTEQIRRSVAQKVGSGEY